MRSPKPQRSIAGELTACLTLALKPDITLVARTHAQNGFSFAKDL